MDLKEQREDKDQDWKEHEDDNDDNDNDEVKRSSLQVGWRQRRLMKD